jgi:hypothetical protein
MAKIHDQERVFWSWIFAEDHQHFSIFSIGH